MKTQFAELPRGNSIYLVKKALRKNTSRFTNRSISAIPVQKWWKYNCCYTIAR